MKISMIISIMFFMSLHPLTMLMTLIFFTFNIIFIMYLMLNSTWFPMILILLILGGMLVLFIYVVSVVPNKKFIYKKWMAILFILPFVLSPKFFILNYNNSSISMFNIDKNSFLLIFITIYLLITLIAVMKLINSSIAPLRLLN
uniref:NADH dehydrogenase subunit 6 n=1 Tax=Argas ricei TaxID=2944766 RepID=UPI002237806B|nr:NADH dehydrogenase subunit 6 [Argas ricei]UYB77986.1 NADH dehydrogenase subunit 6 [Argas sp. San Antonio ARK-2022a]UYB77999.1 NADH dehydrogenase subunit 6 [Argas ricei]